MDLTVKKTTLTGDDQRWLGSAHATNSADSLKIVVASGDVTTYGQTLPSGTLISRDGTIDPTGTGAASGNKKSADVFLLTPIDISRGAGNYAGPVIWHGQVDDTGRQACGFATLTADQRANLTKFSII